MSHVEPDPAINVRADAYFVARTVDRCGKCGALTPLAALGVRAGHETLDEEASADEDASTGAETWSVASHDALIFYVTALAAVVQRRLAAIVPSYRLASGAYLNETRWANHCEHCDGEFDDHDVFCEPGGAFLPMLPAQAYAIDIIDFAEPFAANAAGYSYEPPFVLPADDD